MMPAEVMTWAHERSGDSGTRDNKEEESERSREGQSGEMHFRLGAVTSAD